MKKVKCPTCGADFDESLANCPYCGTMHYPAAEADYMDQMEDIREQVDNLQDLPRQETRKHLKSRGRLIRRFLILIGVIAAVAVFFYTRNARKNAEETEADYLWIREHVSELDSLYKNGDYDKMVDLFRKYSAEGHPVWQWEHSAFADRLSTIRETEELLQEVNAEPNDETLLAMLLYDEISLLGFEREHPDISDREMELIRTGAQPYLEDMKTRFRMDDAAVERIRKTANSNYGVYPYDDCEKYVREFMKENLE